MVVELIVNLLVLFIVSLNNLNNYVQSGFGLKLFMNALNILMNALNISMNIKGIHKRPLLNTSVNMISGDHCIRLHAKGENN